MRGQQLFEYVFLLLAASSMHVGVGWVDTLYMTVRRLPPKLVHVPMQTLNSQRTATSCCGRCRSKIPQP